MSRLFWRGLYSVGPEDIAEEAVIRVFDGRRAWGGEGDFLEYLKSVVDSIVSDLVGSFENRKSRPMPGASSESDDGFELPGREADPFTVVADWDEEPVLREEANAFRERVMAKLAKDPIAWQMFEAIENDFVKPGQIAELLGKPVIEIYAAKKRLQRAVESVRRNHRRKGESHGQRT